MATLPPVVAAHPRVLVWNQGADMHPHMPTESTRIGHVSPQRNRLLIGREYGVNAQHVPVGKRHTQACLIESNLHGPAKLAVHDTLYRDTGVGGYRSRPSRQFDQVS